MRKPYLLAAMATSVLAILLAVLHATAQVPPPGSGMRPAVRPTAPMAPTTAAMPRAAMAHRAPVALLNVSHIFKTHVRFKNMMQGMKAAVEQAEVEVKGEQVRLRKLADQLRVSPKGTPEYKSLEEQITAGETTLAVRVRLQRKEFMQREAKIYHIVYQEIWQEVDYYARTHGIAMVQRFTAEPVDPNKPEDVIRNLNKPVVWYNPDLDITADILHILSQRVDNPAVSGRHGVPGSGYR